MYIEIRKNKQDATWCYPDKRKKKTCIMKWKDKWDLTHGEHISKQVSDSTKISKYGKWASECLTRLWCNMDFVLMGTRKSLLSLFLRKRISVKIFLITDSGLLHPILQDSLLKNSTKSPEKLMNQEIHVTCTTEFHLQRQKSDLCSQEAHKCSEAQSISSSNQDEPKWLLLHLFEKLKQFDTPKSMTEWRGLEVQ